MARARAIGRAARRGDVQEVRRLNATFDRESDRYAEERDARNAETHRRRLEDVGVRMRQLERERERDRDRDRRWEENNRRELEMAREERERTRGDVGAPYYNPPGESVVDRTEEQVAWALHETMKALGNAEEKKLDNPDISRTA